MSVDAGHTDGKKGPDPSPPGTGPACHGSTSLAAFGPAATEPASDGVALPEGDADWTGAGVEEVEGLDEHPATARAREMPTQITVGFTSPS